MAGFARAPYFHQPHFAHFPAAPAVSPVHAQVPGAYAYGGPIYGAPYAGQVAAPSRTERSRSSVRGHLSAGLLTAGMPLMGALLALGSPSAQEAYANRFNNLPGFYQVLLSCLGAGAIASRFERNAESAKTQNFQPQNFQQPIPFGQQSGGAKFYPPHPAQGGFGGGPVLRPGNPAQGAGFRGGFNPYAGAM